MGSQEAFDSKTVVFSTQSLCVPSAMTLLYIFKFNFACILMTFSFIFTFALANYLNCDLALKVRLFSMFAQRYCGVSNHPPLTFPLIHKMALLENI